MAVSVTASGDAPQDGKLVGAVVRDSLEVLTLALRTMLVEVGLHVNESLALPVPAAAAKVMVRGFVAQVALGTLEAENPTAAYAATMISPMETPTRICGKYRLIGDSNDRLDI